jgi:dolichol-phosphate mannosyltransferase
MKKTTNEKQKEKVCIVIPTYNEAENLPLITELVFKQQAKVPWADIHVLVVDDNSPDGTSQVAKKLIEKNSNIHLFVREKKEGLGMAYIAGISYARDNIQPTIIFEMDADLSHNPKYIPAMLKKIREGYDFVIGSRYIKGGSVPKEWGIYRKLISRSANIYTHVFLNIRNVKDCTGGFRAIRATVFDKVDLNNLNVKGYAFQISLLHQVLQSGLSVAEVPIHFAERNAGVSKIRLKDMTELASFVTNLGMKSIWATRTKPQPTTNNYWGDNT